MDESTNRAVDSSSKQTVWIPWRGDKKIRSVKAMLGREDGRNSGKGKRNVTSIDRSTDA